MVTVRTMKKLILTMGLMLPAAFAAAMSGGSDGGGGKGVLCDSRLETLDLWEARLTAMPPVAGSGDLNTDLKKFGVEMFKHLTDDIAPHNDPRTPQKVLEILNKEIVARFRDIPSGQRLPLTQDATLPPIPSPCKEVQIAIYSDDGTIHRDPEYWAMLAPQEKTALILHEWMYHRARTDGVKTSDETRRVIGLLFSGKNPEPLFAPLWTVPKKVWCGAGNQGTAEEIFEFFAADENNGGVIGVRFYFRIFKGVSVSSRTTAFFPGKTLNQMMANGLGPVTVRAENKLLLRSWAFEIAPWTSSAPSQYATYSLRSYAQGENPPLSHAFCRWD